MELARRGWTGRTVRIALAVALVAFAAAGGAIAGASGMVAPLTGEVYDERALDGAYSEGEDDGYADGHRTGEDEGYASGVEVGGNEGYDLGVLAGYDTGWSDGYNEATDELIAAAQDSRSAAYAEGYLAGCWGVFDALGTTKVMDYYDHAFSASYVSTLTGC